MSKNDSHKGQSKAYLTIPAKASTSNQEFFRVNYMQEFLKHQQHVNTGLSHAADTLNSLLHESRSEQAQHFHAVYRQLEKQEAATSPLLSNIETQQSASRIMSERLENLEKSNKELMIKLLSEGHISQAIIDQLTFQDQSIKELSGRFKTYESLQEKIIDQLDSHAVLKEQIKDRLELQEVFHQSVIERISHQEALTEKISRDIDHLKSVIYERVSYIAEKVEENFKVTKEYIFNLFSKSGSIKEYTITKPHKKKDLSNL
ncbi:hypothetical protein MGI18_14690 [Bacillus sp. OVS6]|uniref:hypothetical protein n=1 Tax=Metabacillus dongyingensis TaxID=2874282 RepID=UPI001CBE0ACD|nr:hypothetical protein [Metabacillus dongyingensis]UAL50136.1 hypothetical protein K8L98_12665 [Metabacillus dongyingensis]UOK56253.1 hypothetical protein MGI18_14690 [Bacillus sp. OVS6]